MGSTRSFERIIPGITGGLVGSAGCLLVLRLFDQSWTGALAASVGSFIGCVIGLSVGEFRHYRRHRTTPAE